MYGNRILRAPGKAKAEDLEHIEQKFQVKIPAQSIIMITSLNMARIRRST